MNSGKNRIRLFCSIFIFLCVLSSTKAQDWDYEAVKYERIAFQSQDPLEVNSALISKAHCYYKGSRYSEALATLGRVPMYMLSPEEQVRVLKDKQLYSFLCEDYESASSYMDERRLMDISPTAPQAGLDCAVLLASGRLQQAEAEAFACLRSFAQPDRLSEAEARLSSFFDTFPKLKKESTALIFSFIPVQNLSSFVSFTTSVALMIYNFKSKTYINGILRPAMILSKTYFPAFDKNIAAVSQYNHELLKTKSQQLKLLLEDYL